LGAKNREAVERLAKTEKTVTGIASRVDALDAEL
jgi:hypothetical protein